MTEFTIYQSDIVDKYHNIYMIMNIVIRIIIVKQSVIRIMIIVGFRF